MINLEQVKLLETKVAKAVDYIERLVKENAALRRQEVELHTKLESYQKRIDELEVLLLGFKEDQGRIEEGILAALDRLNQFEKAMEKSLRDKPGTKTAAREPAAMHAKPPQIAPQAAPQHVSGATEAPEQNAAADAGPGDGQTCFEIPESVTGGDIPDPLGKEQGKEPTGDADGAAMQSGELDIF